MSSQTALAKNAAATAQWKKQRQLEANDLFLEFEERWHAGPKDPDRRVACQNDPLLFCRTYLPNHFDVPFSDFHKQDARKLRGAIEDKEWFAIADRREGGKTTRCRGFMLWGACSSIPWTGIHAHVLTTDFTQANIAGTQIFMLSLKWQATGKSVCDRLLFTKRKSSTQDLRSHKKDPDNVVD